MANTVEIVVKGTDQSATRALRQTSEEAKRVGEGAKLGAAGMGLLKAAGAAYVGIKIWDFFRKSTEAAREQQKATAQTAAVLKSTGNAAHTTMEEIEKLTQSIARKSGIDDEQIRKSANMLLTFTNVRNEVGKGNDIFNQATQTVTDMSVALKEDGAKAAIQLGKALNDPIAGITALKRVGVTFSEDQKKQIKVMMEHNNLLGAQKLILRELSKEFGGSAAAQATAADKGKVAWKEFQESVGKLLIPAIDKAETWLATKLFPVLQNKVVPAIALTVAWIRDHLVPAIKDQIGPAVQSAGKWIKDTLVPALQSMGRWIADHKQLVADFAVAIATAFAAFKTYTYIKDATLAVKAFTLAIAADPIAAAAVAILAVAAALVVAYQRSREFRDNVGDAFSDVKIWANEAARAVLDDFVQYVLMGFQMIIDGLVKAFGWLPVIGPKLKDAQKAVHGWRDDVQGAISNLKANIHTEQVKMQIRDMQRRIDDIKQNRVPGLKAGTASANYEIAVLQYRIDHLRGKAIEITTIYTELHNIYTTQNALSNRGPAGVTNYGTGGIAGAAVGGAHAGWRMVGEYGPELMKVPSGSMIYPAGQSRGMARDLAGGRGGPIVLELHSGGTRLDDLLVEILRKSIRVRGGNVQVVLGR